MLPGTTAGPLIDRSAGKSARRFTLARLRTGLGVGWHSAADLLVTAVGAILLWCVYYHRWPGFSSFAVPTAYVGGGDALGMMGIAKGFSELPPPWNLHVERLNAPFGADWNDYPHTEKLIYYVWGLLLRFFEIGTASNLLLLVTDTGLAVTFVWAARKLGIASVPAIAGGIILAFCHFMVGRGIAHINIIVTWHLPLLIYLVVRVGRGTPPPRERAKRIAAYLLMVAASLQCPYYPLLFFQLLLLASARAWLLGQRPAARFGLSALAVGVIAFFAGQLNVFLRADAAGANQTFARNLEELQRWSLRMPDLFLPWHHPITAWARFSETHYFEAGNPGTENTFAFLGLVGCSLFLGLALESTLRGLRNDFAQIDWEAWVVAYVLAFALSGGLGYLLGAVGMTWLRAANRYSIVILCCVLFWGGRTVARLSRPSRRVGIVVLSLAFTVFELFGTSSGDPREEFDSIKHTMVSDRNFGRTLERRLPRGTRVFQLPITGFPESPAINQMTDYEHFRPYLWTWSLRYSYGTHKGRPRESWQKEAARMEPAAMVTYLRQLGFGAIYINREGYMDRGQALEAGLEGVGMKRIATSEDRDLVAFRLARPAVATSARP